MKSSSYDPITGKGAIGVEFAGTAVTSGSPFGSNVSPENADRQSQVLVGVNTDLQWSEGSYRGFFTLTLNTTHANATYYAMRNISTCLLARLLPSLVLACIYYDVGTLLTLRGHRQPELGRIRERDVHREGGCEQALAPGRWRERPCWCAQEPRMIEKSK